jgi:hypothetical protein
MAVVKINVIKYMGLVTALSGELNTMMNYTVYIKI